MSVADHATARDEIQATFNMAWKANTPAIMPDNSVPVVNWQGVAKADNKPTGAPWVRVSITHNTAGQGSLSNATGARLWDRAGIVIIQLFVPLSLGEGLTLDSALADVVKDAFEGKHTASNIWFRNVRINEIGVDDVWFQTNILAEFEYDQIT